MNICIEYSGILSSGLESLLTSEEGSWLFNLAKLFNRKGHNVDVLCDPGSLFAKEENIQFLNDKIDRHKSYDVYICGGWTAYFEPKIKAKLKICCMFFFEHTFYGRSYWTDAFKEENWVLAYPYDVPLYRDFFLTSKNSLAYRTLPLTCPRIYSFDPDKNNYDSKHFLYTGALMGIKVDGGYWRGDNIGVTTSEDDIRELGLITKYFTEELGLELLPNRGNHPHYLNGQGYRPLYLPHEELTEVVSKVKVASNLNVSGSWIESVGAGAIPTFVYLNLCRDEAPIGGHMAPHLRTTLDLDLYLEYPISFTKFKEKFDPVFKNRDRYLEVLNAYRKVAEPNTFENSYKYFLEICDRYL
jgi:hypothetical protein